MSLYLEALQRGCPVLDPTDQLTEGDGALCRCAVDRGHDGKARGSVLKNRLINALL